MTNPTFARTWETSPRAGSDVYLVKDATTLYAGELVATDANGLLDHWNGATAALRFCGVLQQTVTGDTSAGTVGIVDTSGATLKHVAVTGGAQATVNSLVYSADGNIATGLTTSATTAGAIGILKFYRSASDCDVELFTPAEHEAKL